MTLEEEVLESDPEGDAGEIISELKSAGLFREDYQNWDNEPVENLFKIIKKHLNETESLDTSIFKILNNLLKAYPENSVTIQNEIAESFKKFEYEEYFMDKCMSVVEISAAIAKWDKKTVDTLVGNILKNIPPGSRNTDDEFGGTYYSTLKVLSVLSDNDKIDEILTQFYCFDGDDNKVYPYKNRNKVIENISNVLISSAQFHKAVSYISENISLVSDDEKLLKYNLHLKLAEAYSGVGNIDEAIKNTDAAKELFPENNRAYYLMAELYFRDNERARCIQEFDDAYKALGKNYVLEDKMNKLIKYRYFEDAIITADDLLEKDYRTYDIEKGKIKAITLMNQLIKKRSE